jgi:hypothetical protein
MKWRWGVAVFRWVEGGEQVVIDDPRKDEDAER